MIPRPPRCAGWVILLFAASVHGEALLPDDPMPARPDPAKPSPPAAEPPKSEPAPVKPEASFQEILTVPARCRMSKPSAPGEVRTVSGVRITEAKEGAGAKEAWFEVERWVSKEKWEKESFNVKKGERIGKPQKVGGKTLDFSTPWTLLEISKVERTLPGKVHKRLKFDAENKPVLNDKGEQVMEEVTDPPIVKPVKIAALQHVWAKDKDGSPLTVKVELAKSAKVDLPEVSEDEAPSSRGAP